MSPVIRCPPISSPIANEKDVSLSLEMTIRGCGILVSPSFLWKEVPRRGGGSPHSRYRLKKNVRYAFPRFVIPSAAEGSFSFPVSVFLRNAVCMKHRVPTSQRVRCFPLSVILASFPDRKRKRFLAFARNDDTGMRYSRIVHLAKRGAGNKKGNPISEISFLDSG